jgi:pilin isopeptide linkage protein
VSRRGQGTVDFGLFSFSASDAGKVFEYTVREVTGTAANYTYDSSVYKLTIRVTVREDGTLSVTSECADASGNAVSGLTFRNRYDGGETTTSHSETTTVHGEKDTTKGESTTAPRERTTVPRERTTAPRTGTTSPGGGRVTTTSYNYKDNGGGNTPLIPKTGQLWWPVFVMVPGSMLLIIMGVIRLRRAKAEEAEDAV